MIVGENVKRIWLIASGVVITLSAVISLANAQPVDVRESRKEKWAQRMQEIHESLHLEPIQDQALAAHREAHQAEGKALREAIRQKRQALREAFESESYDEGTIRRIHEELKTLRAQQEDHRLEGMFEVRRILTQDQFLKFTALKHERMKEDCELEADEQPVTQRPLSLEAQP